MSTNALRSFSSADASKMAAELWRTTAFRSLSIWETTNTKFQRRSFCMMFLKWHRQLKLGHILNWTVNKRRFLNNSVYNGKYILVTHQTHNKRMPVNETWLAYTSLTLTILSNNQPSAPWHCRDGCVLVTAVYIVNLTQHVLQLNQNQTRIITTADRPTFCASSTAAFFRSFSNCSFVCSSSCSWIASNDTAKQIPPNQTFFVHDHATG